MLLLQIVGALRSLRRDNSPLLTEDLKCKCEGKADWQLPSITYLYVLLGQAESKYTKQSWATKFDYMDYSVFCRMTV